MAQELRLKLTDDALGWYQKGFAADDSLTYQVVVEHLSKEFVKKYQGAYLFAAYFQYKRKHGSTGSEVWRALAAARQAMLDDDSDILVDDLSPAEIRFYLYQLSLSAAQAAIFLAALCSHKLASDDFV
jgi:hypothetical protein